MKRWTDFTPSDMCTLLEELKDCIDDQCSNVKKAHLNLPSPYTVRPEFRGHVVQNYFQCNEKQRKVLSSRVSSIRVDEERVKEVKNFKTTAPTCDIAFSDEKTTEASDIQEEDPFTILRSAFARSDNDALKLKATEIVSSNEIRPGFTEKTIHS